MNTVHTHILASETTRDGMRLANSMATTHIETDTEEITQNMNNVTRVMNRADKTFSKINRIAGKSSGAGEATLSDLLGEDDEGNGQRAGAADADSDFDDVELSDDEEDPVPAKPAVRASAGTAARPVAAAPLRTSNTTGSSQVLDYY